MTNLTLCAAVAAAFGEEWTVSECSDCRCTIVRSADGLTFDLHHDGDRLRTTARYVLGIDLDGYPHAFGTRPAPHITAHVKRGVAALVADIRRRLLPVADSWHADACTKALLAADMHQRQQDNLAQLLTLPNTQLSPMVGNRMYGVGWRADVTSTMVSLHFSSLSPQMTLRLLRLYHGIDSTDPEADHVPSC